MKKNIVLKLTTGVLGCFAIVSLGNYCYNTQANNMLESQIIETEEPIIFNEVSSYDTLYDFSDNKVLAEFSDLIVIGKVTNLDDATNYNPTTKKYGKARTPGNLEIISVIKSDNNNNSTEVKFMDMGGMISYTDYEKSLLPAQKAKRDYLMQTNGITASKSNIFVRQSVQNQLAIEEGKTYVMYLRYDSDYDRYMVVDQPHGVKEYNTNTGRIMNHITNSVETLDELM